jgi:glycosyltransferase involved in cell wall biosynthesis
MSKPVFGNVLYFGPFSDYGGMGSVLKMYAQNIQDFKYISTYSNSEKAYKLFFFIGVLFKSVYVLLIDREIKIMHLHSASNTSFMRKSLLSILGKLFGKKVIFHIHSGTFDQLYHRNKFTTYFIKYFLQHVDKVVCLSNEWLDYYEKEIGLKNVVVIGNPVMLSPGKDIVNNTGILHLLFLGELGNRKAIFHLIEYLSTNKYFLNNQIRLTIGGNGEVDRLEKTLLDPALNRHIYFAGFVNDKLKSKLLKACDIFILPSFFEGLPVAILEAMAFGKPIISTTTGGIPSIVHNGYNGWLFPPGAFYELDDILDEIFNNTTILNTYGRNAYQVASRFSPVVINGQLADLYSSIN